MAQTKRLASVVIHTLSKKIIHITRPPECPSIFTYWRSVGLMLDRQFSSYNVQLKAETVTITYEDRDGDMQSVNAKCGDTLLDVAKNNDIDLEGACEGTLSCSTCHVVFESRDFENLGLPEPEDEELDMLDLAYGLTPTSRLGCQIVVTEKFNGIKLKIPAPTNDARDI
ncbi:2Fe-2S ferredoxin-like isoform X1 [Xenia sp. Carnegie-2017]|uniref:2Fe-2S ferredoxin-like isoform X1 n=1 Tax=Xenia sp. Carnegie-2017 TaxID=2897299 RepID=UPI001F046F07|nr:2Fe-2S ferredoxin-like isoform X1 [Xenia sp. Carnegie-2017]XP_046849673.1 2Fe-2S ferredoxin-like isoform X1 [Xenia sp. Carnegie-2017]